MKTKLKKFTLFIVCTILIINISIFRNAMAQGLQNTSWSNTFLGYAEENTLFNLYIQEEQEDKVVYSYNQRFSNPTNLHPSSYPQGVTPEEHNNIFPIYTKHSNYGGLGEDLLYNDNGYGVKFDTSLMERVLLAGYPHDYYGLIDKFNVSPEEARTLTQMAIYELQSFGNFDHYADAEESSYVIALMHAASRPIEHTVIPDIIGDFSFQKIEGIWQTGSIVISSDYNKDTINLELPEGVTIWTEDGTSQLSEPSVNEPFILRADNAPVNLTSIPVEYNHLVPKTYFYQWIKGTGVPTFEDRPYRNLIRTELIPNTTTISLPTTLVPEDIVEPETPDIPEVPESPDNPENPDSPTGPEAPESPELPGTPETPGLPEAPEAPEIPQTPESPEPPENNGSDSLPETENNHTSPSIPEDSTNRDENSTVDIPKTYDGFPLEGLLISLGFSMLGITLLSITRKKSL